MKLDHVQKITLSGILLALIIIFTRFLALQYIPFLPFIRISIGPALIIFSSILLGPLYGGLLGGLSDLLGILLVPNPQGFMINPFIILLYTILGILPYFVFKLIKKVKSQKKLALSFYISLFAIWVFIFLFLMINHEITLYGKVYPFDLLTKVLIISLSFLFLSLMSVGIFFIHKHLSKKDNPKKNLLITYQLAFVSLVSEVSLMLILGSIIKTFFFELDFLFIFFSQAVVLFINIPLNTLVVSYLLNLFDKLYNRLEVKDG